MGPPIHRTKPEDARICISLGPTASEMSLHLASFIVYEYWRVVSLVAECCFVFLPGIFFLQEVFLHHGCEINSVLSLRCSLLWLLCQERYAFVWKSYLRNHKYYCMTDLQSWNTYCDFARRKWSCLWNRELLLCERMSAVSFYLHQTFRAVIQVSLLIRAGR